MKSILRPVLLFCGFVALFTACELDTEKTYDAYGLTDTSGNVFSGETGGENYGEIVENPFVKTSEEPTSTFSIDADGAAYANMRRMVNDGVFPIANAIRTEELINYFTFDYPEPLNNPISLNGEVADCPWSEGHKLIRIGIKGRTIPAVDIPNANYVLLIDVSGSMSADDKLQLLKRAFVNYVDQMRPQDRIAIVTYAGSAGVILESTPGTQKSKIIDAIGRLGSGGGTAGAEGLLTAYKIAEENFIENGNNRIILGTDGDFNIGPSSTDELVDLIEHQRDKGIFITVLGVGTGNLNDNMLELISNNGNGTYEYLDSDAEAEKVFRHDVGKFFTVAKDVKIQVSFNPELVQQYRLIGYENRVLNNEDFEDDKKDAGEIGAGQTITALYEIIPANGIRTAPAFTIDFRYKKPSSNQSEAMVLEIRDDSATFDSSSESMRFAAAVAGYGLLIRDSAYKGTTTFDNILTWAGSASTFDPHGYREAFLDLVKDAKKLKG